MAKIITAEVAKYGLLAGDKLYQIRARLTLPYLVRQAKAGQTIYYSDLAKELNIPNPRSFNYILGAIGNALIELGKSTGRDKIPPIQCFVINKSNELPGEGISWFINDLKDFSKLPRSQQKKVVEIKLGEIYIYQEWDWVLSQLGLQPVPMNLDEELEKAKNIRGGGESESHRRFKEFVSRNPTVIGLKPTLKNGALEQPLASGDTLDILFTDKNIKIGVEVKSEISGTADIMRGIFQCVKYKCIIEAQQVVENQIPNSRVILALQGELPEELMPVKNILGVEVIDGIKMPDSTYFRSFPGKDFRKSIKKIKSRTLIIEHLIKLKLWTTQLMSFLFAGAGTATDLNMVPIQIFGSVY